jgi:hypothetical protein
MSGENEIFKKKTGQLMFIQLSRTEVARRPSITKQGSDRSVSGKIALAGKSKFVAG